MVIKTENKKKVSSVGHGFADAKMHLFINVCFRSATVGALWGGFDERDGCRLVKSGLVERVLGEDGSHRLKPTPLGLELYENFRAYVMGEIARNEEE